MNGHGHEFGHEFVSEVMTRSMSDSVSELPKNLVSVSESASDMDSCTNSCPNSCPCPFISAVGFKLLYKVVLKSHLVRFRCEIGVILIYFCILKCIFS